MNNYRFNIMMLFISFALCGCDSKERTIAKAEIANKTLDFGQISMMDSIIHTFFVKNVSNIPMKITNVGTSCGCTTTNYTQEEVKKNEVAFIEVIFKPDQQGQVDKSIVVEANTDPPFNVFYLKGEVK